MKVRITFPLVSGGACGEAAGIAARHSGYRPDGGVASVELSLPDDWREFDRLWKLLRSERGVECEVDGGRVSAEELSSSMRCFLRKQRSGKGAKEWCTPARLADRQLFPCKQIHVYDNDHPTKNSWYSFGGSGEDGVFRVDRSAIADRVLSDLGPRHRCPLLNLDEVAETIARVPGEIDPARDPAWRYRGGGALRSQGIRKAVRPAEPEKSFREPRESVFERIARGVRSGGTGVVAGGPAPGARNVPETRYEDVGGMKDTVDLVREAVELPITHPEIFEQLGIRPHRGILFHGPPGTGKTLLARAVAHECGAHFIAISGPEILNKYWGQSEARLRNIFAEARAKAPSIVLFDEIDSFASSRDMMSESFEATLVSQLLSLMDGMNDLGRVCVVATTNRPAALDPALRRPGRFDHEVEIGLPDETARLHILKIHTRDMPTDPDLDLAQIARVIGGYSGADIEALCREAALASMRRTISLHDLKKRISPRQLDRLSVTTYDFRAAMKRAGVSRRR